MEKKFYIYIVFRPWDGSPCYVGKGSGNRWRKLSRHDRPSNERLSRIYEKSRRLDLELPVVKVRENLTEAEAFQVERAFIAAIGRGKYGPLVNLTDGGEGPIGARHSKQTKLLIGAQSRMRWADPAQRKQIISAQNEGRSSPEYREERRKISKRISSDPARRAKQSQRVIERFSSEEVRRVHGELTKAAMADPKVRERVSKAQKQRFSDPIQRAELATRRLGKKHSAETRAKMSASRTGRVFSSETRAKLSAWQIGRKMSDESRAKMSASAKARWAKVHTDNGA